jgi:hypothetical protein
MQQKILCLVVRLIMRGSSPTGLIHLDVSTAAVLGDECKYEIT